MMQVDQGLGLLSNGLISGEGIFSWNGDEILGSSELILF